MIYKAACHKLQAQAQARLPDPRPVLARQKQGQRRPET